MRYKILLADDANPQLIAKQGFTTIEEFEREAVRLPTRAEVAQKIMLEGAHMGRWSVVLVQQVAE